MNYADAIVYLKEHDIKKEDGTYYEFGEVGNKVWLSVKASVPPSFCLLMSYCSAQFITSRFFMFAGHSRDARAKNDRSD